MPIALLMDISQSFDQTEAETGIMITVYAWMVAILSLPLMLAAGKMKEKTLLLLTLLLLLWDSWPAAWLLPFLCLWAPGFWWPVPMPSSGPL